MLQYEYIILYSMVYILKREYVCEIKLNVHIIFCVETLC